MYIYVCACVRVRVGGELPPSWERPFALSGRRADWCAICVLERSCLCVPERPCTRRDTDNATEMEETRTTDASSAYQIASDYSLTVQIVICDTFRGFVVVAAVMLMLIPWLLSDCRGEPPSFVLSSACPLQHPLPYPPVHCPGHCWYR